MRYLRPVAACSPGDHWTRRRRSKGSVNRPRRRFHEHGQVELRWRAPTKRGGGGGGSRKLLAPYLRPGSPVRSRLEALPTREEHDTPPPPLPPSQSGANLGGGGGTQCKGSTSEVMVLAWGMGREGRGSEESWASGRVNLAHVGRVWVALAYPERRRSPIAHTLKTKQKHTKTNTHTHTGSSACSS